MNNKQKIIISVIGIFIVLLLLVGLTYGYFLTKISSNTNNKSISVSTANLALVYGDGNGELVSDGTIIPGTTVSSKTFTVTNEGNATTDYAVVLENYKVMYAMTSGEQVGGATTTLSNPDDFKLKITCTSSKDEKTCNGLDDTLPTTNDILLTNSIEIGETQSYELSLEYVETGTDQSNDMNKTIEGKINIIDTKSTVDIEGTLASYSTGDYVQVNSTPKISQITSNGKYKVIGVEPGSHTIEVYSSNGTKKGTQSIEIVKGTTENVSGNTITITEDSRTASINITSDYNITIDESIKGYNPYKEGTLAYNIINNAMNANSETSTIYSPTPITTPAVEISGENERTLSITEDDYGTSYYYRGNVENNYLSFNNMCWRIVRIEGDGSIKIVLADATAECSVVTKEKIDSAYIGTGDYGYDTNYMADYENSQNRTSSMKYKFNIFLNGGSFDSYDLNSYDLISGYSTITKTYTAWSADAKSKLKTTTACIGDVTTKYDGYGAITTTGSYYYDTYVRLNGIGQTANATLICNAKGTKTSETQIFPLTADEVVFAGGKEGAQNSNYTYYLRDAASSHSWWTLSPSLFAVDLERNPSAFSVSDGNGSLYGYGDASNSFVNLRPAVSLKANISISSGDGSISNPYKIK